MIHELKIEKPYADAILEGNKTFEIRYNDRGYQKGDLIKFNVTDDTIKARINHPLNDKCFEITYIIHGWGLRDNWCVFAIKENKE